MYRRHHLNSLGVFLIAGLIGGLSVTAQIRLPTLKEATELSRKTGAPILAMAGRET